MKKQTFRKARSSATSRGKREARPSRTIMFWLLVAEKIQRAGPIEGPAIQMNTLLARCLLIARALASLRQRA